MNNGFKRGDFLISSDARKIDKSYFDFHQIYVYTGGTVYISGYDSKIPQLECHSFRYHKNGSSVYRNDGSYSHFLRKMTPEEKEIAMEVIKQSDYLYDEENVDFKKKPIEDISQLKERLLIFIKNYNPQKDERDCLTDAVNSLL